MKTNRLATSQALDTGFILYDTNDKDGDNDDDNNDDETQTKQSAVLDDINPEDRTVPLTFYVQREHNAKHTLVYLKASSTASARPKAEADKAALVESMNALKRKH